MDDTHFYRALKINAGYPRIPDMAAQASWHARLLSSARLSNRVFDHLWQSVTHIDPSRDMNDRQFNACRTVGASPHCQSFVDLQRAAMHWER